MDPMSTQPQVPNPGPQAAARSIRRVPDYPAPCPEPVELGHPAPSHGSPTPTRHVRPCPAPPRPQPPKPAPIALSAAPARPPKFTPKSDAPRPQEFFGKNSYCAQGALPNTPQTPPIRPSRPTPATRPHPARPLHSHLELRMPAKDCADGRRNHRPRG